MALFQTILYWDVFPIPTINTGFPLVVTVFDEHAQMMAFIKDQTNENENVKDKRQQNNLPSVQGCLPIVSIVHC